MPVTKIRQNFRKFDCPIIDGGCSVYRFGSFALCENERLIVCEGSPVDLKAKDFDVLLVLLRQWPNLVTKSQLLDAVWPNSFVEEANLGVHIAQLRKALRRRSSGLAYIQTVNKYGYRFSGEVERNANPICGVTRRSAARMISHISQEAKTECTRHNGNSAEAILTLRDGLQIEVRRRATGVELSLTVPPETSDQERPVEGRRAPMKELVERSCDPDGTQHINVSLDYYTKT